MKKRVNLSSRIDGASSAGRSHLYQAGMSLLSVTLALLISMLLIGVLVSRFQGGAGGDEAVTNGPADLLSSMNYSLQTQTIANMGLIARTNELRQVESGSYAERLADLDTLGAGLTADGWGNPYVYTATGGTYTLTSLGADGAPGPAPPSPWQGSPYDPDLVMVLGRFTQAPSGR